MHFDINKQIITGLFAADDRRLNGQLIELKDRHKEMTGSQLDGFLFRGKRLVPRQETLTMAGPRVIFPPVHKNLIPEVDLYLKDVQETEKEKAEIRQVLSILLRGTKTLQHMRDALPDCVIQFVPVLKPIHRFDEAAWTIKNNPAYMRQYTRVLPMIEAYAVANMLY